MSTKDTRVAILIPEGLSAANKKKVEAFLAENEALKGEVIVLADYDAELTKDYKDEIGNLKKDLDALGKSFTKVSDENKTMAEEMAKMSAELSTAQDAAEKGYLTVKSGSKTYRVHGKKFSYKGVEYTADSLIKNEKLVKELVALKVGFLTEIEKDKEG